MESFFISDIHLKSVEERNGKILLRFLHELLERKNKQIQIFLLGDIFDLWVSDGPVFIEKYHSICEAFRRLINSGVRVVYFEGNHDLHLAPFWRKTLHAEVYTNPQVFEVDQLKIRVEHGDLINLEDKAYLRLRRVLRHPWVEALGHTVPGWFWLKVGEAWSPHSRKKSGEYRSRNEKALVEMIRHHAQRAFAEKPFDLIVTGHMHVRDDHSFQLGLQKVRSVNLGSWFEEAKILKLASGQLEWITLY